MYRLYSLAKYKAVFAIAFAIGVGLLVSPGLVTANTPGNSTPNDVFGLNPISEKTKGNIALGTQDIRVTVTKIINVALSLLGIVAVVIILIGGFKWMTAGGNDEQVGEARKWIFSGIIGLAIILSAWAIARFVLIKLGDATEVQGDESYVL